MPQFTAQQLAIWTTGSWTHSPKHAIVGFSIDTRSLQAGELFVALKTARRDGHDFLHQARAAGASATLVSRPVPESDLPQLVVADPLRAFQQIAREHRRNFAGPVIGISGSAGKTSTKNLLALLLADESRPEEVLATRGNLNNTLGVPLTLTRLDARQHAFAVIEAGISERGEMDVLAEMIEPDLGLITLVAPAHIEALESVEGVAREKAKLLAGTRTGGLALFPRECLEFESFRALKISAPSSQCARRSVIARRPDDQSALGNILVVGRVAKVEEKTREGGRVWFSLVHQEETSALTIACEGFPALDFSCRRVSDGMAQNAVLAVCAALRLGVEPEAIRRRLARWEPARLRGEIRRADGRFLYLDCYNANPASMADALEAFDGIAPVDLPRFYVVACMEELGAQGPMLHRALGRNLRLRPQDCACVIGTEAAQVLQGALEGGLSAAQVEVVTDKEALRAHLADFRGAVFIKGSRRYELETLVAAEAGSH